MDGWVDPGAAGAPKGRAAPSTSRTIFNYLNVWVNVTMG
jgi:hypothetical protein